MRTREGGGGGGPRRRLFLRYAGGGLAPIPLRNGDWEERRESFLSSLPSFQRASSLVPPRLLCIHILTQKQRKPVSPWWRAPPRVDAYVHVRRVPLRRRGRAVGNNLPASRATYAKRDCGRRLTTTKKKKNGAEGTVSLDTFQWDTWKETGDRDCGQLRRRTSEVCPAEKTGLRGLTVCPSTWSIGEPIPALLIEAT